MTTTVLSSISNRIEALSDVPGFDAVWVLNHQSDVVTTWKREPEMDVQGKAEIGLHLLKLSNKACLSGCEHLITYSANSIIVSFVLKDVGYGGFLIRPAAEPSVVDEIKGLIQSFSKDILAIIEQSSIT